MLPFLTGEKMTHLPPPPPQTRLKNIFLFSVFFILFVFAFYQPARLILISNSFQEKFWDFWIQSRAIVFLIILSLFLIAKRLSFSFIQNKNAPFVFYTILLITFHFFMTLIGDDIAYSTVLYNSSAIDWLIQRYNTWSSRFFVDFIIISFAALPYVFWKIFNTAVFLFIAFQMNKLLNPKNNVIATWLLVFLIAIYPFYQLNSAGWIATMCSYALPLAGLIGVFVFLENIYHKKTISTLNYIIFAFSFLCATSQEQSALVLLVFLVLFLCFCNKNRKLIFVLLLLNIFLLGVILLAPGNWIRLQSETQGWFPAFADFNIFQKISIGIFATANVFLKDRFLLLILSFALFVLSFQNYKKTHIRFLAIIQLFIAIVLCSLFLNSILKVFGIQIEILNVLNQFIQQDNIKRNYIIPDLSFSFVAYLSTVITWYLIIFYLILKNSKNNYLLLFVFVMGLFSKAIMGFSPTVFASSDRTAIFAYFALIAVNFYFLKIVFERASLPTQCNIIFGLLLLTFINVARTVLIILMNQENIQSADIGLFFQTLHFHKLDIIWGGILLIGIFSTFCLRPYFKKIKCSPWKIT